MADLWLRDLGQTGLKVSAIGLGTVKMGRKRGVKYPGEFTIPDDKSVAALLDRAWAMGINLIDSAPAYGSSEARLGGLLMGQRDRWIICTKAGEEFDPDSGESRFDFCAGAVTASLERSLTRLRTDRVEVLLLHSDGRDSWIIEDSGAMAALERAREGGKVRAIGISTKTPDGAMLAVKCGRFDAVMLTLNLRERADLPAIADAHNRGVGVLVKKPLASGHESAEASLRLVLGQPGVSAAIVGTINPDHLEANIRSARLAIER